MEEQVYDDNEVLLDGVRCPILGPMRETTITPFPAKIAQSATGRDDEVVASSIVWEEWTGGLGVFDGTYPRDQDRFRFSTMDTRYPKQLTLAPRSEAHTTVDSYDIDTHATVMIQKASGTCAFVCCVTRIFDVQ